MRLFLFVLLAFSLQGFGQSFEGLEFYNHRRQKADKISSIVLGSWAIGNIGTSVAFLPSTSGRDNYFFQMNIYWNLVNLGLASYGYYKARNDDYEIYDKGEIYDLQKRKERIYLFNSVLDVGYMTAGSLMQGYGNRTNRPDLMRGFGRSIFMQGSFLLVFDLTMYFIHARNYKTMNQVKSRFSLSGDGAGVRWQF